MKLEHNNNFLHSIDIKVSEEVTNSRLKLFIQNSLLSHESKLTSHTKVFYSFLVKSSEYQICFYDTKKSAFESLINTFPLSDNNIVYVFQDLVFIFINRKFYYFQQLTKEKLEDDILKIYFENRLEIKLDKIIHISQFDVEKKLRKKYHNSFNFIFFKQPYKFVFSYLLLLFSLVFLVLQGDYFTSVNSNVKEETFQKKYLQLRATRTITAATANKLSMLFSSFYENKLTLKNLNFNKKSYQIEVLAYKKESFYNFVRGFKYEVQVKSIAFNPSGGNYVLKADIDF